MQASHPYHRWRVSWLTMDGQVLPHRIGEGSGNLTIKTAFSEETFLGGGFKYFLFSALFGEMIQFDEYFSDGWFNHQLVIQESLETFIG